MIDAICKKYNINDPDSLTFCTLAGLKIDRNLTFSDYGIGTLIVKWNLNLCTINSFWVSKILHFNINKF